MKFISVTMDKHSEYEGLVNTIEILHSSISMYFLHLANALEDGLHRESSFLSLNMGSILDSFYEICLQLSCLYFHRICSAFQF